MKEKSALRNGLCLVHTQQTKEMKFCALCGIRTRDPSNQAASGLRLRPHGHRDLPQHSIAQRMKSSHSKRYVSGCSKLLVCRFVCISVKRNFVDGRKQIATVWKQSNTNTFEHNIQDVTATLNVEDWLSIFEDRD